MTGVEHSYHKDVIHLLIVTPNLWKYWGYGTEYEDHFDKHPPLGIVETLQKHVCSVYHSSVRFWGFPYYS